MNYYYFFVTLECHLAIHLCNPLPLQNQLFDVENNVRNRSSMNQSCQRHITYSQVLSLLSKDFCPSHGKPNPINNKNNRTRRNIDAGNIDIKALQTTINDHRVMTEYLFNNTINETFLANALYNHARTVPSLSSWRDLVDIFCVILVTIFMIYLLVCRTGFSLCDRLLIFFFQPVFNRLQQRNQQQQHQLHQQQPRQQQQHHLIPPFPTAHPKTTSDQLKSLSMIADGITMSSNTTEK